MKPTQASLQKSILIYIGLLFLLAMLVFRDFRNLVLSLFFGFIILVMPFWLDSLMRYRAIPFLDSLNEVTDGNGVKPKYPEDFPLWMRVLIWGSFALFLSLIWTVLVPAIFSLPLWIGRLANAIGLRSLFSAERTWQYGWMIAFLAQYIVDFGIGFMVSNDQDFEDRFEYP